MVNASYLFTLLAATAAVASPIAEPIEADSLEARAGQIYTCKKGDKNDGALIGKVPQDKAIGYFREAKTKSGKSGYPKKFDNKGKVMSFASGCTGKEVWELPVLNNGVRYDYDKGKDGNNPGPMRVYYAADLTFCAIGSKSKDDNSGPPHNCKV
ncbi:hypothetical protein JX265_011063 [Neoarthrinium moseri]|uniref:Uncharacterized protein n=1 Tax=Neoarthrinium moseri TaxID=1658444 RepID=A0A9P9WD59_9PEZI|nr:uncharacterized protein JN550_005045 [Neoarthrinium moseri]KAI1852430.1 hypothetical protein JX266_002608 [Neoarthrinium moseri]KAI1857648.1 hypothetical protein JX265_011063 [Neoarthrinium moseri]KAI1870502.1 hypothetical protein JN550_005045 [Neoarthrinium moseri]